MIDLNIRVTNPNVWEVKAKDLGFMEEVGVEGSREWQFKAGINVDEIHTIWITAPTYDEDGLELTSGTKAQGQHFNIRIFNPEVEALWSTLWTETLDEEGDVISRTITGALAANSNKSEKAWIWQGVEFIDMTTVVTPKRKWL